MIANGSHFTVSVIDYGTSTDAKPIDLTDALSPIREGQWRMAIGDIRENYTKAGRGDAGKKAVARQKLQLPGILFSGTFTYRSKGSLIQHSGLICCDLDNLGSRVASIKEAVSHDPCVLIAFLSPTGEGLKVVLRCDPTRRHEEETYPAAHLYMLEKFGVDIDSACSDVSRICFVSDDPDIFIADRADCIPYPETIKPIVYQPPTSATGANEAKRPGDDYNLRGDVPALLKSHGWTPVGKTGWRRPGKDLGVSATYGYYERMFHVFTSSTQFEANRTYMGYQVFAILECSGDFREAARRLAKLEYGEKSDYRFTPIQNDMPAPAAIEEDWGDTAAPAPAKPASKYPVRPITSYAYPSEDDPNTLLGNDDYLGRGGGMLFVSHAGAGKSSWIMDACMMWAIGRAWMGIKCNGPLKSLIIQAEDSDRYIGKIFASFAHVNRLTPDELELLTTNCNVVRLKGISGANFFTALAALTTEHTPDLVIVNPVYLYADGDISRSEYAQPFLVGLDGVNRAEKFAYILIHHTGKPAKKDGKQKELDDWESAYMGFGSSYFANWPRCTALLEPTAGHNGRFQIKLGKGGLNAGITREVPQGAGTRQEPVTRIAIKHSTDRMDVSGKSKPVYYWEMDHDAPESTATQGPKAGRPSKYTFSQLSDIFPPPNEPGKTFPILLSYARSKIGISETAFRALVNDAVRDGQVRLTKLPTGYVHHLILPGAC